MEIKRQDHRVKMLNLSEIHTRLDGQFCRGCAYNLICSNFLFDSPTMAESTSFKVEEGDVILLGTDGLFDNMGEDLIVAHIAKLKVC